MQRISLFERYRLGQQDLKNRIVMAPMTRARSLQPGNIPSALMAEYYRQRASAGLIITEATQISPQGQGYSWTPGIHSPEQVSGWQLTTGAVHQAGGVIFSQLWHVGRMSHASFHQDGQPVAPSALAPDAQVWVVNEKGEGQMVDCPQPRTLSRKDIHSIIADYRQAALNAVQAGFDGVEVHGGNGYLIDQFLRQTSNKRTDEYGGTLANRIRFAQEVLSAIAEAIGRERTGIRLSPFITQRGMNDPQVTEAILALAAWCEQKGIAFIHLAEADWDDAPQVPEQFRQSLRETFSGTLIVAGNYNLEKAEKILASGYADLIAFGRPFIANPDLPHRLSAHAASVHTFVLDISREAELVALGETLGEVNNIVVTAGSQAPGGLLSGLDLRAARLAFDTKFWGSINVARYLSGNIAPRGTLTFTSGFVARRTVAGAIVKTTMNAAIEAATKVLAKELSPLRVNVVSPGLTDTEAYAGMDAAAREKMLAGAAETLPAKAWGRAEDIAQGYLFAIDNPFVTGAVIDIEGGALIN